MDWISVTEAATRWGVDPRVVQRYCASGKIAGAKKYGRAWMIPANAQKPLDNRAKAETTQPEPLYPGLFLLDNLRFNGQSVEIIAASLPDIEHRREFYSELAFLRGEIQKSLELLAQMPETSPFRLTGIHMGNIAAIRKGDENALRRGMDALKARRQEYAGCPSAQNCIDLAEAVVYAGVYAPEHFPEWLKDGDVLRFSEDVRPFALYLYALYLNNTRQQERMLGVTETVLALVPEQGFTIAGLYLRIMRVSACVAMGDRQRARELIAQALDHALPYGLVAPFSEHLGTMRGVFEEVARERFPWVRTEIIKGWKEAFTGWTDLRNRMLKSRMTTLLTSREYAISQYLVDGKTSKEIAELMHTTVSGITYSLQIIREKLGVRRSRDIVKFVN
ncbi:helix-turn-helix domain-containing protein [Desulfonatronum thiodismutans]|uniref:helix-turn-helix domain-containing protein n=1 Tax=Desulfonatronum thiodismutans TaxID=159290 RepID=UPI00054D69B0|nr:helix-turn-helix domain-containing protein [Desulfonatronum thiodismutans]